MFKKLIALNIVFILIFSTAVYASSMLTNDMPMLPDADINIMLPDVQDEDAPDYTSRDYMTDETQNSLELVTFLMPDDFSETFMINKDVFDFSSKALSENLIIRLYVFDEEYDRYVPLQKEIIEILTEERFVIDTTWRFGLSGYLFCSFKIFGEGTYEYRLLIHDSSLESEELVLGENLQVLDFTVTYKEAISFEDILMDSFWDIYFDPDRYSLPFLP